MRSRSIATRPVMRPTAMSMVLDVLAVRSWLPPASRNWAVTASRLAMASVSSRSPVRACHRRKSAPARRARRTRLGVPRCGAMVVLTPPRVASRSQKVMRRGREGACMTVSSPRPRLLLVEDDPDLSQMLAELLGEEGYAVTAVHDGQAGLHRGLVDDWDLLVVDRGLPGIEGVDLVTRLRSRGLRAPVLFLTARGTVADRVEGLDAGAQDYVVKPFDVEEVLARLRALLRPVGGASNQLVVGERRRVVGGGG